MALTTGEMSAADLAAIVGGENNDGFGNGNGWWIILFFLLCMNGGWGNGFNGGNGGGNLYPWMNQAELTNSGFRDQMINSGIASINSGINGISTQICNGFAGVEQGANARQMADMNQNFAMQTAMMQGFNGIGSQFSDCCCENRLGLADLKYTVATENCADRAAVSDGIRDVIASNTANTQAILDKLCALELDGVKNQLAQAQRDNVGLQNQLNMANLAASQANQTAAIEENIYSRLKNCPVPSMPVYGNTPIFTCNNGGCGCGM